MFLLFISLLAILIALVFIFMKEIFFACNVRLNLLRSFLHHNSGIFTLIFIFLFFVEQILLLILVSYFEVGSKAQLLIGIFALIVLTTATIEKFILEKKNQYLASQVYKLSYDNEQNLQEMKKLYDDGNKLVEENLILKSQLKKKR